MKNWQKKINASLFMPPLKAPIKTLDLPVAGRVYPAQARPLLFDLVNIANEVPLDKKKRTKKTAASPAAPRAVDAMADMDGATTIEFLKKTKTPAYRISSMYASSLGLHPAVYFYSATGRHQPSMITGDSEVSRRSSHPEPYLTKSEVRLRVAKAKWKTDKQTSRRILETWECAGFR